MHEWHLPTVYATLHIPDPVPRRVGDTLYVQHWMSRFKLKFKVKEIKSQKNKLINLVQRLTPQKCSSETMSRKKNQKMKKKKSTTKNYKNSSSIQVQYQVQFKLKFKFNSSSSPSWKIFTVQKSNSKILSWDCRNIALWTMCPEKSDT